MFSRVRQARNTACTSLQEVDLFGERVQLTFQRRSKSSSPVGIALSCLIMTMFAGFFAVRTINFIGNEDPFFAMMTMPRDL